MPINHSLTKLVLCLAGVSSPLAAEDTIRFNRDIRPILSENCYHCHGPDENARTADLRLDTEEGAKEFAIIPGDADASELVARIHSDDPDAIMPPRDSERSLSPQQIDLMTRWVAEGADYEEHWSFIPPRRPAPPPSENDAAHPIDRFITTGILARQLTPASPATRTTLIRRATFDLIGLPPTIEEIDVFLSDQSADAYQHLLDRLLARKEFGERMATDWMDVARYSDTYGYQVDRDRYVWPWRDWVIDAYNHNMPYDQFISLQLAGDLMPGATSDQILATTFNRLHPQKVEGGSVPEEFRMEYVADRTQTVATALMGLTMECCRCHNHKYDPLTQQEYYELSAFFDKIDEAGLYSFFTSSIPTPTLTLPTPQQQQSLDDHAARVRALEQKLAGGVQDQYELAAEWIRDRSNTDFESDTLLAKPIAEFDFEDAPKPPNQSVKGVIGKGVRLTGDDAIKTKVGNFRRFDPFSVSLWMKTPDRKDRAVIFHRSRAWTDAASRGYQLLVENGKLSWSLIHFWPGNAISIRSRDEIPVDQWVHVVVSNDGSGRADGLQIFVNGQAAEVEIVRDRLTKNVTGGGGDTIAIGERFRDRGFKNGSVDQFRVYDSQLTPLEVRLLADPDRNDIPGTDLSPSTSEPFSPEWTELLIEHHQLRHDQLIERIKQELKAAREQLCKIEDAVQEIMVMREMDSPRQSYLLQRGGYDNRGKPVQPATPGVLPRFPEDQPTNRLGLARWLTDADHPLTARVAVNRLWQLSFGVGLVRTPEDFGSQGQPPTHPELLDWLAIEFVDSGWNVKHMLKRIMTSATYRRASWHPDPDVQVRLQQSDPENRLYARFPSYRLPAEMLRDNSLAISGRLVSTVGGPPVKPYEIEASFKPSDRDKGEGLYRRSLYTYWKRTGPAPAMMALDASKRDVCRVRRERTSSPIQALVLLNGPQYVEAARGLAERLTISHGAENDSLDTTLGDIFRVLTSREPDDGELRILRQLYREQLAYFSADPQRATAFLSVGDAALDSSLPGPHVAALTVVVGTVMNFDQSVMKR
jgi:hypothetical protein